MVGFAQAPFNVGTQPVAVVSKDTGHQLAPVIGSTDGSDQFELLHSTARLGVGGKIPHWGSVRLQKRLALTDLMKIRGNVVAGNGNVEEEAKADIVRCAYFMDARDQ